MLSPTTAKKQGEIEREMTTRIIDEEGNEPPFFWRVGRRYRSASLLLPAMRIRRGIFKFSVSHEAATCSRSLRQTVPSNIVSCISASIQAGGGTTNLEEGLLSERAARRDDDNNSVDDETALRSLAVLIAEDNRINQKVLVNILNRIGIQDVKVAANGQQAIDFVLERKDFDVVLMDMQMPIMDGLEACRHIQNHHNTSGGLLKKQPEAIFVTAHALGSYEQECYKAGAAGFLSKPCDIQSVKQVLTQTMIKK